MSEHGSADDNRDQDGLTSDEEQKCREAFEAFDKDGSAQIDAEELRVVLEMMGRKTSEEEVYRMIAEADASNSGQISYE